MSGRRWRAGVIGCGFFAANHLHAWRDLPEVELAAVCDRDPARAEAARTAFGVPRAYADAAAMLAAERLDFVDIVTTMESHRPLVELAAAHGVPAIVQKPFAPSWADCLAMVARCRDAGVALMVHENFRFQAPILAVRAALRSGRLGRPHFARLSFRSAYDVYAAQPYLATDERFILIDLGIHLLDVARVLMGEVESLLCTTARINPRIRGEDSATALLRHAGGAASVVDCCYASRQQPDPFPQTLLQVDGDRGTLQLLEGYRLRIVDEAGLEESSVEPAPPPWAQRPWHVLQQSVLTAQRRWIDALAAGSEPETSGADNLRTYALMEACYESAARGQAVSPKA